MGNFTGSVVFSKTYHFTAVVHSNWKMARLVQLGRRHPSIRPQISATTTGFFVSIIRHSTYCSAAPPLVGGPQGRKEMGEWLTLPPFRPPIDAASVAKEITAQGPVGNSVPFTALKWVRRCCPQLPMSLVQKLFRLRQVRKEFSNLKSACLETQAEQRRLRRVSAKDAMVSGDVILLPVNVQKPSSEKHDRSENEDVISFIRSLELYKDSAIIAVNKPPGMPVQGGVGIKYSVDTLADSSLKYDYPESPRLVHRLDRDSSGVLVLGRTQTSASILHSIFREKTSGALCDNIKNTRRALERKYWALVIGTPRHPKGLISAPLAKVVLEDGKSERVTIVKNVESTSSQHALTEYKVIRSSIQGYTWLELSPLTGRKHQLRVHCAEALRTPIVGDYKYGWHAHRKWQPVPCSEPMSEREKFQKQKLPFGLDSEGGSISEKQPRLHLHCRQMVLPDVSAALEQLQKPSSSSSSSSSSHDFSKLKKLNLVAPLPQHMQKSWKILSY